MNKRTKYTVWAFWDKHPDFNDLYVSIEEPLKSVHHDYYHSRGRVLLLLRKEQDKLAFMDKVLSIRPGECKSFEVEVDEV